MREFYLVRRCWQAGTRPVQILLHRAGLAQIFWQMFGRGTCTPGADYTQQNRPGVRSHLVMWGHPCSFTFPVSGSGNGHDGDCGSDYFRYRNREKSGQSTLERVGNNSLVDGSKTTRLRVVLCVPVEPRITGNSCWTQNFKENWTTV